MNCYERYQHLKFIRDCLFDENVYRKESNPRSSQQENEQARAQKFIEALKKLPCIGEDGETLKQANEFASHEEKIFTTFNHHYSFLPPFFTGDEHERSDWIKFFIGIGLRTSITRAEFLQFCRETSRGEHEDPRNASSVLLGYLFSEQEKKDGWKTDRNFLFQVSNISFVCTMPLHNLSWIKPVAAPTNTIQHGRNTIQMTQLNGAAVEKQNLLWTVRPVVSLPYYVGIMSTLLTHVKVVRTPSREDVIQNIRNICSNSRFVNFKLFDNYPKECETPEHATGLLKVMVDNFQFLQLSGKSLTNDAELSTLESLPCIPVCNTVEIVIPKQIVLVKPCHVLTSGASEYHPFLNSLPCELNNVVTLLTQIGVHSTLQLSNIQVALQTCFENSQGQDLAPNDQDTVENLVKQLYRLLVENKTTRKLGNENVAKSLAPLYLPSTENKLVSTSVLLYCDNTMHKSLRLADTGLSILSLPPLTYQFFDYQLCEYLPEELRPKSLRQCTNWRMVAECKQIEHSETAKRLQTALSMSDFPKAVIAVIKHHCGKEYNLAIEEKLVRALQNIYMVTIQGLKIKVTLKETDESIGTVRRSYHLQSDDQSGGHILYLDSTIKKIEETYVHQLLTNILVSSLRSEMRPLSYSEMEKIIKTLFQAATAEEVLGALWREGIMLVPGDIEFDPSITLELSKPKPIPECWYHRLEQDFDNVFHPMERVGYKDEDSKTIVFARVIHPIPDTELQKRYKIYTSENDEEGIEVSVLDLYKFLRGLSKLKGNTLESASTDVVSYKGESASTNVVPYEGESDTSRIRSGWDADDIKTIKRKLCKDLKVFWTLPEAEKKESIGGFYMKWDPDKNPDNLEKAEIILKFLNAQIERLEQGLDPDEDTSPSRSRSRGSSD